MNKYEKNEAIGESWESVQDELFTPEEISISDLRVKIMFALKDARKARGLSQAKLGELSGVKQPVIARMERGASIPNLETLLKVLAPLGKTLELVSIDGDM